MKKFIKQLLRENLIKEGASPILYHFSRIGNLVNILNTNTFYLTSTISSPSDKTDGNDYFMSFSRTNSIKQGYGKGFQNTGNVRIKIDGQKIGNNYKVRSIDYWQTPRTKEYSNNPTDEFEDRIITNKSEIPNANRYIISIDIHMGKEGIPKSLLAKANELDIKINIFDNIKDFASGREDKVVDPIIGDEIIKRDNNYGVYELLSGLLVNNLNIEDSIYNHLGKLGYDVDETKKIVDNKIEDLKYPLSSDYGTTDVSNSLLNTLHNSKSGADKGVRFVTKMLNQDMRKMGVNTINDYLNSKNPINITKKNKKNNLEGNIGSFMVGEFENIIDKYGYRNYLKGGVEIPNVLLQPEVKEYLDSKFVEIYKHVKKYIGSSQTYMLTDNSEIRDSINLDGDDVSHLTELFEDVDSEEIKYPIKRLTIEIGDYVYENM